MVVLGGMAGLLAVALVAGGGVLLWANGNQRTADGYFNSPTSNLTTNAYALTSAEIDLGTQPGGWLPSGRLAAVRLEVESMATIGGDDRDPESVPVFVGIGRQGAVDTYLEGVAHTEVTQVGPDADDVTYRAVEGTASLATPAAQAFWAASTQGTGTQTLIWELERGEWAVVIMNADATPGVTVTTTFGARTELVIPVAVALILGGLLFAGLAVILTTNALRRSSGATSPVAAAETTAGSVRIRS